jgi:hypothetical protein
MYWTKIIYVRDSSLVQITMESYSKEDAEQRVFEAMKDPAWYSAEVHYSQAYDVYRRTK